MKMVIIICFIMSFLTRTFEMYMPPKSFVCMYVTILLIQVCTTLQRALLRGDSARIRILTTVVGPRQGSLAMDNSSGEPSPTASCVGGSGKHGPHSSTGRTTLQIILSALNLYPCRGALPNPMDDEESGLASAGV